MNAITLIAANTFKETIRNKVLYNVLFFAIGFIFLSVSFGEWSVFARVQVMQDFGLATMSIAGLLLAIFIGVGMLGKEISSKTIYQVITNPIERYQFILGKYAGLLLTLFINFVLLTAVFFLTVLNLGGRIQFEILSAILLIWVELAVIVSVAILFSTLTTPTLASIFTLGFYIAGHYNDLVDVEILVSQYPFWGYILKTIYFALPNLEHFNIRSLVIYELNVPAAFIVNACLYGCLYVVLFLTIACLSFESRDV
ncbi:MAG: hypothetical protein GF398_07935 [Chitinivibrionales bacterium]|nr:hypothetical protein [Chitinivibrionales bacterium]